MTRSAACIVAAIGASGTGKTHWMRETFARQAKRLAVWDFKATTADFPGYPFTSDARVFLRELDRPAFRIVFRPGHDEKERKQQFAFFNRACYAAGNLTMMVDELALVTSPMSAPDAWRRACLTGRDHIDGRGRPSQLRIIAASQRPASVDKDFFGNCTLIHCGRLVFASDLKAMANVLRVDGDELASLPDRAFVERDLLSGGVRRSRATVTKKIGPLRGGL